jgi:hypothetical protein
VPHLAHVLGKRRRGATSIVAQCNVGTLFAAESVCYCYNVKQVPSGKVVKPGVRKVISKPKVEGGAVGEMPSFCGHLVLPPAARAHDVCKPPAMPTPPQMMGFGMYGRVERQRRVGGVAQVCDIPLPFSRGYVPFKVIDPHCDTATPVQSSGKTVLYMQRQIDKQE